MHAGSRKQNVTTAMTTDHLAVSELIPANSFGSSRTELTMMITSTSSIRRWCSIAAAMPVILTDAGDPDNGRGAPMRSEGLHRPLPDSGLKIVARGRQGRQGRGMRSAPAGTILIGATKS
jgi:hypothetical protein